MKTSILYLFFVLVTCTVAGQKKQQKPDLCKDSYTLIYKSYDLLKRYRDSAVIVDTSNIKEIQKNFEQFDKQIHLLDSALQKCLPTSKVGYKKLKRAKKDLISHRRNHLRYFKKKVKYLDEMDDKVSAVFRWYFFWLEINKILIYITAVIYTFLWLSLTIRSDQW